MEAQRSIITNIAGSKPFKEYSSARIFNSFPKIINSSGTDMFDYSYVFNDEMTNDLIRKGQTIGCFYIESPGMRSLLQKLDCHSFEMLTAASSIIRPGVAESGMMKEFIERHKHPERRKYIVPEMEEFLGETYGVMVYQEDVIKIAHHVVGLTLEEADLLRRAMSGRFRSREGMGIIANRFFDCCRNKNFPEETANQLWREIASFAGYAFCKAHSASFAVLSYQVAYLKAHHPAEFMAGVLNNGGGYYSSAVYISECRRMGLKLLLPDVNESEYEYRGRDGELKIGLAAVRGLEQERAKKIIDERNRYGKYKSLKDFLTRTGTGLEQTELLIKCGAMDCFKQTRPTLLRLLDTYFFHRKFINAESADLFAGSTSKLEKEVVTDYEFSIEDKCRSEYNIFGYMVSGHPLNLFEVAEDKKVIKAADMQTYHNRRIKMIGWYMAAKRVTTSKGKVMKFLSLEDTTGTFEAVIFPEAYAKYAELTISMGPYVVEGKVDAYSGNNIIVDKLAILSQDKAESITQKEKTNKDFFGDAERPLQEEELYLAESLGREKLLQAYI